MISFIRFQELSNPNDFKIIGEPTLQNNCKYQMMSGHQTLGVLSRLALLIRSLVQTIFSFDFRLSNPSLRQQWQDVFHGKQITTYYVQYETIPKPTLDPTNQVPAPNPESTTNSQPLLTDKHQDPLPSASNSTPNPGPIENPISVPKSDLTASLQSQPTDKKPDPLPSDPKPIANPITTSKPEVTIPPKNQKPDPLPKPKGVKLAELLIKEEAVKLQQLKATTILTVKQNGLALEHLPENLKSDIEVVTAAVKQNGWALKFASADLRRNPDLLLEAARNKNLENLYLSIKDVVVTHPDMILNTLFSISEKLIKGAGKNLFSEGEKDKTLSYILTKEGKIYVLNQSSNKIIQFLLKENLINLYKNVEVAIEIAQFSDYFAFVPNFNIDILIKNLETLAKSSQKELIPQTLVSIGKELGICKANANHVDQHYDSQPGKSLGFIIATNFDVYIQGNEFAGGTFKKVYESISLGNSTDFVWMTITNPLKDPNEPKNKDPKPASKPQQPIASTDTSPAANPSDSTKDNLDLDSVDTLTPIDEALKELNTLKNLHNEIASDFIAPMYNLSVQSGDGVKTPKQLVLIQKRFHRVEEMLENINEKKQERNIKNILIIAQCISKSLSQMHKKNWIHSDVKAANILYEEENGLITRALLTDFGTTIKMGEAVCGGSLEYSAPEIVVAKPDAASSEDPEHSLKGIPTPKVDSWAFGVTLMELITGDSSFKNTLKHETPLFKLQKQKNIAGVFQRWSKNKPVVDPKAKVDPIKKRDMMISSSIMGICQQLIKLRPEDRITCGTASQRLELIDKSIDENKAKTAKPFQEVVLNAT